jgi:PleD family two-component response regulator
MILCAVDDLIFSIKISTAAKALGADVFFERSPDQVVARIREKSPHLVIFDLNSSKLRPLATIEQLKTDAVLKTVPTLGYVSHVDSELIAAARRAGIDEVMARSAFSARLGEILSAPRTTTAAQPAPRE